MQPAILVQKQIQDDKNSTKLQLEKISKRVLEICCFGGNNWSESKELSNTIKNILDEVFKIKNFLTILNSPKIPLKKRNELKASLAQNKLMNPNTCFGIPLVEWNDYFSELPNGTYTNPAALKIILSCMHQMIVETIDGGNNPEELNFYLNFQKLKTFNLSDFNRVISNLTYDWMSKVKSPQNFLVNRKEEIRIGSLYSLEKKEEPTDKQHRRLLIQYLVNDLKFGAFYFGIGNCQLMAELAFLLTVQTLSSTPIRYVQFQDKSGEYEELNAIVIGDWKAPGCTVLAPWYSRESFEWKGSLDKTPEINHYNITTVLFTIQTPEEKAELQTLLTTLNFNVDNFLNNPNRSNYLEFIQKKSKALYRLSQGNDESNSNKNLNN